jgi:hypothetical protein
MKHPTQKISLAVMLAALLAALAAFVTTSQAQSLSQLTNGLVSYYPLDQLSPGSTNTTPDLVSRRDLTMNLGGPTAYFGAGNILSTNSVAGHPGMGDSAAIMNLDQSPSATLLIYQSSGQNPQDGSGDFLPFINQRGATMNFWMKGPLPGAQDLRVMAECAQNGDNNPFFSLSAQPATKLGLGYFLRENATTTDPNGVTVNQLPDGTYQTPSFYYEWSQSTQYTTNTMFDNNWHMLTTEIETNGDVHVYVDGNYDPGNQSTVTTDNEGRVALAPPVNVTNSYYNTNIYPFGPMTTNGGTGLPYVHWMVPGLNQSGAATAFGGFYRNGGFGTGPAIQLSDVGFWNRTLTSNEIQWLMTNGISGISLNTNNLRIVNFFADFGEVGAGSTVNLHWNVQGANSGPGGIVITGIGDVSSTPAGEAQVTVGNNASYTFTLHAHNGLVADQAQNITVKTLAGVPHDWNLVQRWDGLFGNTSSGVNGDQWVSLIGNYAGTLDRFNVVTVNGNKVLSPKSGFAPDTTSSPVGWDTRGALSYGFLNGLTIPPYQENTLFFRFSVTEPTPVPNGTNLLYSALDFAVGLSDFGFATGPLGGSTPPGGGGTVGPGIHILQYDSTGAFQPSAWNLTADDFYGPTSTVSNTYNYLTAANGSASGLLTNVTYYCWLDVSNDNTQQLISGGTTNTQNEPVYGLWIQKQGDPARTQLFSNFHGDRNYATAGQNSDNPRPYLDKVYVSVATENILNSDQGSFFATNNMILVDDFYMSTNGYDGTIPRLFDITGVNRGTTPIITGSGTNLVTNIVNSAAIRWDSLGSMFQLNTYSVQRKLTLKDASWVTLTNGMPSGGDFTTFTDTTIGNANTAFYRITWP